MAGRELVSNARKRLALGTRYRAARDAVLQERYARWRTHPVEPNTVLYESFSGNGMLDNPEAIFRHLLSQPDMAHLEHVWVLDDLDGHPEVTAEFADHPKVRFVEILSPAYFKALATAKYLINNATFPQELAKRPEQVYLNTWHGVPLKYMGFDMQQGGVLSRNITRNFLQADYLVSANPYMTETMYRKAYRMQGIFPGAVVEEGHPRTDRQVEAVKDPDRVVQLLESRGVRIGGRKIVLYAPTWRGETFQDPHVNAAQLLATVRDLQESVDSSQYVVLLKVHQVVYNAVRARVGDSDFLVPNSVPTNLTLGVTDLLVTDYSSIFFDYLATGRPVLHYVPDLDDYQSGRGLYLSEDELPGPISATMPDLAAHVQEVLAGPDRSARTERAAAAYTPKDDGSVCERLVDLVFRGAAESQYTVHRDFDTEKPKLLVYLGAMKSMGITTSALNLMRNIDYDKYDVTAFYVYSRGRDRAKNIALVDPRARVIPRAPIFNATPRRVREETKNLLNKGLPDTLNEHHTRFWTDEWRRMFGDATFDHLIDFSGYGCFSPFLFSVAPAKSKSIWLHNDMYADMQRETIGEKHLEDRLGAVFTTYKYFDHLVSVSPELDRVNREKLAAYASPEKFTYAVNTMDGDRVLKMAGLSKAEARAKADGEGVDMHAPEPGHNTVVVDTENIASTMATLLEYFTVDDVIREARSRARLGRGAPGASTTFVTVGRLSPEKNHARLINAFAQVHEKHPDIRLVILGGGKLEEELQQLVVNLGLESYVTLAGQVDNPFAIMAECDCFVLSSDYEGQPMVILEARTLGLPVITTAFSSVGDSVPEDAGIVVPQTVKGVAKGLERFLRGKVPAHELDCDEYNRRATEQFDAVIASPVR
ncbi:MAG: CDP-glycerol glycerophosphotransferase family protein [Nocardioidaceae bacterium]